MSEAPKLLTEREWRKRLTFRAAEECLPILHENGLIAPEPPVDPLNAEVEALLQTYWDTEWDARDLTLAALHRGMELALTEQVSK